MSFVALVLVQLIVFVLMIVVLRQIFTRHLVRATAHFQGLNAEYTRRHDELKEKLAQAETQYTEQVTRAKQEAERLVLQARQEADSSRGRVVEEARLESERIMQQALESRDAIRRELEQALETRVIDQACRFLEEALPEPVRRRLQASWIDELLADGLRQLKAKVSDGKAPAVRVVSALPLDEAERRRLERGLHEVFGAGCQIQEEVEPRLVAGLSVTVGSVVLDGSLGSTMRQLARDAQPHA